MMLVMMMMMMMHRFKASSMYGDDYLAPILSHSLNALFSTLTTASLSPESAGRQTLRMLSHSSSTLLRELVVR